VSREPVIRKAELPGNFAQQNSMPLHPKGGARDGVVFMVDRTGNAGFRLGLVKSMEIL
jgi:hypothetical protein